MSKKSNKTTQNMLQNINKTSVVANQRQVKTSLKIEILNIKYKPELKKVHIT